MYTGVILCVVESCPEMILKITNDNTTLQEKSMVQDGMEK